MPVSSFTRYVCDLAGCGFTTEDPAEQARFVKLDVHVDQGNLNVSGVYCSKTHAVKALRDITITTVANPDAERERAAATAATLARRPAKGDSRAAWNEYADALIEGFDASSQPTKAAVVEAVEAREQALEAEMRLPPAEDDAGAVSAGRRQAARRALRV